MSYLELKGHYATIPASEKIRDELTDDALERIQTHFEDDEAEREDFVDLLYRSVYDRERIIASFDILGELTKEENDEEILKDCIRCLGRFPKYEKLFLMHVLASEETAENRFRFLEETIFSRPPDRLEDFKMGAPELNSAIVENLENNPLNGNDNITRAVERVLDLESTEDPFPQSAELYEVGDNQRSLKTTFAHCQSVPELRLIFLKNLLLEADRERNIPLVVKIVLTHCDVDLRSVLDKVNLSEDLAPKIAELRFTDNPCSSEVKEAIKKLSSIDLITSESLKKLVHMAAGLEED